MLNIARIRVLLPEGAKLPEGSPISGVDIISGKTSSGRVNVIVDMDAGGLSSDQKKIVHDEVEQWLGEAVGDRLSFHELGSSQLP